MRGLFTPDPLSIASTSCMHTNPHLDSSQVATERGEVGCEALLITDVSKHRAEGGDDGRHLGGDREARPGHERRQTECLGGEARWGHNKTTVGLSQSIFVVTVCIARPFLSCPTHMSSEAHARPMLMSCPIAQPTFMVAVFPPVLGPVMTMAEVSRRTRMSTGRGGRSAERISYRCGRRAGRGGRAMGLLERARD